VFTLLEEFKVAVTSALEASQVAATQLASSLQETDVAANEAYSSWMNVDECDITSPTNPSSS
jgi:hypothetical protein